MNFKSKLYNIFEDLNNHKRNKNELFEQSVENRLNKALIEYDKSIAKSYNYLIYKNQIEILRKINKLKQ